MLALLGFGLGAVLRSSAGAVAVLSGVLFVPTLLAALLPSSWQGTIGPYLPMNADDSIYTVRPEAHMPAPWTGLGGTRPDSPDPPPLTAAAERVPAPFGKKVWRPAAT
jgi:hypothetical protein